MSKTVSTLIITLFTVVAVTGQNKSTAITGIWLSPKKDSKIEIFQSGNKFYGKIIWGTGSSPKDVKNPDKTLRNRDLIGLSILNGFVFDGDDTWEDGTIYDPREGKTYSCKMEMDGMNKLKIRGFIGISLLGRTETWTRVITQ